MSILSNRLFCDRIDMNWKIHIILHNKLVSYLQLSIIYKIKINHSMNILYLQPMSWIQGSFAFVFRENRVGSIVPTRKCESWNIRAMDSELFFYSNYDCKNYANRKVEYNIPLCEYYKKNCRDIKSPVWYAMLAKM